MSAAIIAETAEHLRHFMQRHEDQGYRPVPLAQAIGEKDVRRVRAALREMAANGEVVTCEVYVPGSGDTDIEVRLVVGGKMLRRPPPLARDAADAPVRRADASHIPSHYGRGEAIASPAKPIAHVAARTLESVPTFKSIPGFSEASAPRATAYPVERTRGNSRLARRELARDVTPASSPNGDSAPATSTPVPPAAPAPAPLEQSTPVPARSANHSGVWRGGAPTRQLPILQYITKAGRGVSMSELYDEFEISAPSGHSAVRRLAAKGDLVFLGKLPEARRGGLRVMTYATPEVAAKLKANTQGSGGEATPAEQPVPGEAAAPAAAPRDADRPAQKTAQGASGAPQGAAYKNLASYFIRCEGNWYGLSWLVQMANADVPETLEALARLMRERKVTHTTAGSAPIWHPVESVEAA